MESDDRPNAGTIDGLSSENVDSCSIDKADNPWSADKFLSNSDGDGHSKLLTSSKKIKYN